MTRTSAFSQTDRTAPALPQSLWDWKLWVQKQPLYQWQWLLQHAQGQAALLKLDQHYPFLHTLLYVKDLYEPSPLLEALDYRDVNVTHHTIDFKREPFASDISREEPQAGKILHEKLHDLPLQSWAVYQSGWYFTPSLLISSLFKSNDAYGLERGLKWLLKWQDPLPAQPTELQLHALSQPTTQPLVDLPTPAQAPLIDEKPVLALGTLFIEWARALRTYSCSTQRALTPSMEAHLNLGFRAFEPLLSDLEGRDFLWYLPAYVIAHYAKHHPLPPIPALLPGINGHTQVIGLTASARATHPWQLCSDRFWSRSHDDLVYRHALLSQWSSPLTHPQHHAKPEGPTVFEGWLRGGSPHELWLLAKTILHDPEHPTLHQGSSYFPDLLAPASFVLDLELDYLTLTPPYTLLDHVMMAIQSEMTMPSFHRNDPLYDSIAEMRPALAAYRLKIHLEKELHSNSCPSDAQVSLDEPPHLHASKAKPRL